MVAVAAVLICLSLSIPVFTLICAKKRRHTMAKRANHKNSPLPSPTSPICPASLVASQIKVSTAHTPERIGIKKRPDAKKHEEKKAEVVKEDSSIADKLPEDKTAPSADARKVKSNEHLDQSDSDDVKKDKVRDRIEPHRISLNAKEKLIALGAKRNKDDYPTMGDIISDWETKEETQKKKDQKIETGYRTDGGERGGFEMPSLDALRSREIMKVKAQTKKKSGEPIEDEEKTQKKGTEELKEANVEEEGVRRNEEGILDTEEIKRLASEMLGVRMEDAEKLKITEEDHRRRRAQKKKRVELEREMMREYEEEMRSKEYVDRRKMANESAEKILERKSREKEEFKKQEEQREKKGRLGENIRMDLDMKETQKTRSRKSATEWDNDVLVTKQTQKSAERDLVDVEERPKDPITEGCNEMKKQNLLQSREGERKGLEEKCIRDVVKFSDTNVIKSFAQKTHERASIGMQQKNFQSGVNSSKERRKEKEGHSSERKGEKNYSRSDKYVKKKKVG